MAFRDDMSSHNIDSSGATFEDLAIDDTLTDLERVVRYVHSNIALQRVIHVRMLEETAVAAGFEKTVEAIVPVLEPLVSDAEFVVRQHLAGQFPGLCKHLVESGGDVGYKLVLDKMVPLLNRLVTDVQAEVRHIATDSVVLVAGVIKPEDQGQHILTLVLPLAHEDGDEQMRITALTLLNKLAVFLGPDLCCQFCVPEFISLAGDPVFRVRKAIALNCVQVCTIAGPVVTEDRLLPAFLRLAKDDIWGVRKACAESLSDFAMTLSGPTRARVLAPLFSTFATDQSKWVRIAAYQQLGPLIATLSRDGVSDVLVTAFTNMATKPSTLLLGGAEADIKFHCAYNYPAVAATVGPTLWGQLAAGFDALTHDGFWKVRRTLSYSLHEMAKLLGPDLTDAHLVPAFAYFLDDIDDVKLGSITHFGEFLARVPPSSRARFLPELAKFTALPPKFKLKWRIRAVVAEQLPAFCTVFETSATFDTVAPLVFALSQDDVACVRDASIAAMPSLFASVKDSAEWTDALTSQLLDLQTSPSYLTRQTFLRITRAFLLAGHVDVFDARLRAPFVHLAAMDLVLNVRLLAARILVDVAAVYDAPAEVVAALGKETDADIQAVLAQLAHKREARERALPA
ncbi:hypothetical protein H257_10346 [Aphanomyces astaci]|uniref:Phosphatase PP2A regulatory subunit A/Splicing factor 3B subunit 1-like HEAT repeat domain-containing protein n=2 Tax=Aphanomyces astaci TaxID=112090 RepID=W4G8B7_APHAT|nr:hypothetical protein H257_10346 [Aphanomyces astaci]ETV75526.1 hypothetical protein H257_10346 [Aphanomyces astaci]|eukprot:XP_009835160.1 hypothetical protein H257_10346 [Aphanomyces astaci]